MGPSPSQRLKHPFLISLGLSAQASPSIPMPSLPGGPFSHELLQVQGF